MKVIRSIAKSFFKFVSTTFLFMSLIFGLLFMLAEACANSLTDQ